MKMVIFRFIIIYYLYNKRACPQTMFKILRLRRQHCQIKGITGLPKTWGQERERERAENKNVFASKVNNFLPGF